MPDESRSYGGAAGDDEPGHDPGLLPSRHRGLPQGDPGLRQWRRQVHRVHQPRRLRGPDLPGGRAPFRQGRSQRHHGRGFGGRCADRGPVHRQWRQVRGRADPQRRCGQGLQPPQNSLQPRLRLGLGNLRRRGAGLRDRQGVSRLQRRRPGIRQECPGADALDPHHAHRRRRCRRKSR